MPNLLRNVLAVIVGIVTGSAVIPAPPWFIALDLLAAYLPIAWLATQIGMSSGARVKAAGFGS